MHSTTVSMDSKKNLENYLCCFVGDCPKNWSLQIPMVEWWHNATYEHILYLYFSILPSLILVSFILVSVL